MKNTKKVVALALALSVSSQAIPSYAEGVTADTSVNASVDVAEDTAAPSANDELKAVVDEKNGEVTISQNCIYDLESGIDEESVKAYVYEEGSEDKGEAIEMAGTSFSDFSVKAEMPEAEGNLVVEVHASDLAGNESVVSKATINKGDTKASSREYSGHFYEPENGYFDTEKITINPKKPFVIGVDFTDPSNDMSELKVIVNTNGSNYSNGIIYTGSFKSNGDSKGDATGTVSVKDVSFENYGYGSTRANMAVDFGNAKHASSYYIWVSDETGNYSKVEYPIVIDSKAPETSEKVDLSLSRDEILFVSMDGVEDAGSSVKEVYALIKNEKLSEPVRVWMLPNGDSLTTKLYEGNYDLKTLNVNKGEFTIEVYAIDNCGNEGMIATGKIEKDTKIESEEFVDMEGQQNQVGGTSWYKYNGVVKLSAISESKDSVYNGAQVIITEDGSDPFKKVIAEFKLGSKQDLTNATNNKYVELVSGDYSISKRKAAGDTYVNELTTEIKLKDGAYNKKLHVWVQFYADNGLTSKFTKVNNTIATDYTLPSIAVTEISNGYFIKADDEESGLKYVEVYDKDGLLITEDYSEADGLIVAKDKNPSTITVVDCVNNKIVYDVVNKKIIEAASTQGLPKAPTEDDKYIDLNAKPDAKPEEKPDVKPEEKPEGENNGGQGNPDVKPEEKPDVKPEEKPDADKPNTDKPEDKPVDKPNTDKPNNDGQDKPNTDKPNNDGQDKPNTDKPNTDKPNTDKPNNDGNGDNGSNDGNNGGTGNDVEKPNTDKPNTDGNGDNGSTDGDNVSNDGDNGSTDKPAEKPNTDGNDGNGSTDKPADKPNTDGNDGNNGNSGNNGNDGNNGGVVSKPQDGQSSNNNGGANGTTNGGANNGAANNGTTNTPAKPTLPQTGGTSSILVGAFGAVTSAIGYVLTRKRK